jgi:hypothetical protein
MSKIDCELSRSVWSLVTKNRKRSKAKKRFDRRRGGRKQHAERWHVEYIGDMGGGDGVIKRHAVGDILGGNMPHRMACQGSGAWMGSGMLRETTCLGAAC